MSYLIVLIVNDPQQIPDILEKWENLGIIGITILDSYGHGKIKHAGLLDNVPIIPSLENLAKMREIRHKTLFSVVEQEELVDRMIEAAQEITGNLNDEHTGFLFVVPVVKAIGLQHHPKLSG